MLSVPVPTIHHLGFQRQLVDPYHLLCPIMARTNRIGLLPKVSAALERIEKADPIRKRRRYDKQSG
jgi:hypothetical protein